MEATSRIGREYYISRKAGILALFDTHAQAWKPFIISRYGDDFADTILREAREQHEALIPEIPYIGGDENPMTRHLIRSTTSLAFYQAMKTRGKTAEETGRIVYDAVVESVRHLSPSAPLTAEDMDRKREQARKSQKRRYPGDWVWEFIAGTGQEFDYGYDFFEVIIERLDKEGGILDKEINRASTHTLSAWAGNRLAIHFIMEESTC